MKKGFNCLMKAIIPVLTLSLVVSPRLYASEALPSIKAQNKTAISAAMPAPPTGPYRSAKHSEHASFKIPTAAEKPHTPPKVIKPEPMDKNNPSTKNKIEYRKVENKQNKLVQKNLPPLVRMQPAAPQLNNQFYQGFKPAAPRRWMPPPPTQWIPPQRSQPQWNQPQWNQQQRRYMPRYPIPPMRPQAQPRPRFNNRNWMPPPPPPWVQQRGNVPPGWIGPKPARPMPPRYPSARNFPPPPAWQNQMPPQNRRW